MSEQLAHNTEIKIRTEDIKISENVNFTSMLLSDPVLQGLLGNGFKKPSPIQLKAIPMGRCGFDLIIQAKSGTGKTAVFGIIALEMIDTNCNNLQVLILAPTREIAVQIQQVILSIGMNFKDLKVQYFIGGTSIEDDKEKLKNCHIAVGAPGRVKHLIKNKLLKLDSVKLFVLDEADKLMGTSYQGDINFIYHNLGSRKQMIASSATYPDELDKFLTEYMNTPIYVNATSEMPVLLGIKQFVSIVGSHLNVLQQITYKTNELIRILQNVSFTQCIVFCNYQTRASSLNNTLITNGWPSNCIIGSQDQKDRLEVFNNLKKFKCRILTTTDLTARGIDAANVDLIINFEVPNDPETYLHRMGRAGRYGSAGICITITDNGDELKKFKDILNKIGRKHISVAMFPKTNEKLSEIWDCDINEFDKFSLEEEKEKCTSDQTNANMAEVLIENLNSNDINLMQDSVEMLLKNLNKNEKHEKESLKNKGNESILTDLLQIQTKSNDEINLESSEEIGKLFASINEKEEDQKSNLKEKFGNLETSNILSLISEGKLNTNSETNKTKIEKSKQKKKKTSDNQEICYSEEETIESEINNLQFDNEARLFQENTILNKNIALYNLMKFFVADNELITEESTVAAEKLLNIFKEKEEIEKSKLKLEETGEILSSLNLNESKIIEKIADLNKSDKIAETRYDICYCPENLFSNAFSFVMSKTNTHWQNEICLMHQSSSIEDQNELICDEEMQEEEEYYGEEMEEYYEEEEEMHKEEYYEEIEENYDENQKYEETEQSTDEVNYDEELFVKAFNYALENNSDSQEIYTEEKINKESEINPKEIWGYAAGHTYRHFTNSHTKNKRKHMKSNSSDTCTNLVGSKNVAKYESHFDYCDNILATNAPYFTDVPSFEKWFKQWQENLYSVRNFVQQDVFINEVLGNKQ